MKYLHKITFALLVIGGLNWLIFAISGWDIGALLGGMETTGAKIVYIVVGVAAVYEVFGHMGRCKGCDKK